MKIKNNTQVILSTLVCLLPIILSLILYDKLPNQLPIHFGMNGEPDNYASKAIAAFLFPCLLAALNLFVHIIMNADPKRKNANIVVRGVALWTSPIVSLIFVPITLFKGMGYDIPIETVSFSLIGLMYLILGNYMPKSRQSYTVGIRLPWTLDNEENWNKTHRFGGFVWVLGGLAIIVNAFIGNFYFFFAVTALLVILPIIYSYLLYRKQSNENED